MKKTYLYLAAWASLIVVVMNGAIWQKEQILDDGEIVFLKLAPVDPRSLMQGDYMILNYEINDQLRKEICDDEKNIKHIVITQDEQSIAHFVGLYNGQNLLLPHKVMKLDADCWSGIIPNTFLFQEGYRELYETAEYGIFIFDKNNPQNYLLNGLADKDLQRINP